MHEINVYDDSEINEIVVEQTTINGDDIVYWSISVPPFQAIIIAKEMIRLAKEAMKKEAE